MATGNPSEYWSPRSPLHPGTNKLSTRSGLARRESLPPVQSTAIPSGFLAMTIQPTFGFARLRRDGAVEHVDRQRGEIPGDGEKSQYPVADSIPSVSSFNSDEKQTFGVSKVEAITTVWTKAALITLYVLYPSQFA